MRRLALSLVLTATLVLPAAACGKGGERAAAPAAAAPAAAPAPQAAAAPSTAAPATSAPATTAPAPSTAAPAPPKTDPADAAEMRKAIAEFTLTDKTLDAIIASEKELGDFWANPQEAMKIRGERKLAKILTAIDASPRLKGTLEKHGLTGREYILGTFSMIGGFMWEKAKATRPELLKGQTQPVNDATLAVVHRRLDDITKLLSPPQKPAKKIKGHEGDDF